MASSSEAMQNESGSLKEPIYVYEAPVRIWHWLHALSIIVLCVSGYLIANPLPSLSGEASEHFLMGQIRLFHFVAAYVFAIGFIVRAYWALVGNEISRELFVLPITSGEWWRRVGQEIRSYALFTRKQTKNIGHNALAQIFLWLFNVVLVLVMIFTGGALYSQGTGLGSWPDILFGWVFAIIPSSQAVRMYHLMGMWLMVLFAITHIYIVIRAEFVARQNSISGMISGWRSFKDDGSRDPQ